MTDVGLLRTRRVEDGIEILGFKRFGRDQIELRARVMSHSRLEIPSEIDGVPVVAIASNAFSGCFYLEEIVIPEGVKRIGDFAFQGGGYGRVELPSTLEEIGDFAFLSARRFTLDIRPNGCFLFDDESQSLLSADGTELIACYTRAERCVVPESVATVREGAFSYRNSLRVVVFGANLSSFPEEPVFLGCGNLEAIEVDECCFEFSSVDGVFFQGSDADALLCFPPARKDLLYEIPDSTTEICYAAFVDSNIRGVRLGANVSRIRNNPFVGAKRLVRIEVDDANLHFRSEDGALLERFGGVFCAYPVARMAKKYAVPDGTYSIGPAAFMGAKNLGRLDLPDSIMSVEDRAFAYSGLEEIVFPDGLRVVESSVCQNCAQLQRAYIPDTVTTIEESAFEECPLLGEVRMSNETTTIGARAFCGAVALKKTTLPDSICSVGSAAFHRTGLERVDLPDYVEDFSDDAFDEDTPLYVRENSPAHEWAFVRDLNFRFRN